MEDLTIQSNNFLYDLKEGEGYFDVIVTKRTTTKIYLSNGVIIHIKKHPNGFKYFHSKGFKRNNKLYPLINQVLRDIQGFLVYKKLTDYGI